MKSPFTRQRCAALFLLVLPGMATAQIHAMLNYETKSPDSLKALKTPVATGPRKEGIAVIDVDPRSKSFGQTIQDIPLPADLVAHHIFYNRDQTKAYVTAPGKGELRVIDMKKTPYSTGKVLGTYRLSTKPSPGGDAPVEIVFVPGANPPVACITNMYGGTLWTAATGCT